MWDTEDRENSRPEDGNDELVDTTAIYRGTKKPHVDLFVESNQASKCSMNLSGTPEHTVIS